MCESQIFNCQPWQIFKKGSKWTVNTNAQSMVLLIDFFFLQSFGVDFKHDWWLQHKSLVDIYRSLIEHFCTRRPLWAGQRRRTSVRWQKWTSGHSLGLGLNVFNLQPLNAWRHSWHSESKSSNLKSSVVFQYLQDIQYLQDNKDPSDILARESNL